MLGHLTKNITTSLSRPVSIAPLITFRILFSAVMMFGAIRFCLNGWIEKLYVEPNFFFKFYGFHWVTPLSGTGMYCIYAIITISAFFILLGLFYHLACIVFFLSFTYVELIDASNYLNHYYLVCLLAFLMIFLPANRAFSLDSKRKPSLKACFVPAWTIKIIIIQLIIVYTCAGIAKLNADWLFKAMPMSIWLPERQNLPILGYFFQFKWMAYLFSWGGAFYDLSISFFLLNKITRPFAYFFVVLFHVLTKILFNIGLFPVIMICSTLIFFSSDFHQKLLGKIGYRHDPDGKIFQCRNPLQPILKYALIIFIGVQLLLPFRHYLYPGDVLWTEEGYRFSWRVMLVEKSGLATFYVKDSASDRKSEIVNGRHLTLFQEKQMAIQPDFIVQYARYLGKIYETEHEFTNPIVTVDAYVALNGRTSKRFIDPSINLASVEDGLFHKNWILARN